MNHNSIDEDEIKKFSDMADEWWDKDGKFKPLHDINQLRVEYICNTLYDQPKISSMLDIGCGGGILSESMAKFGYEVTGIDPATQNIKIAQSHAHGQDLNIDYRSVTVERLLEENNNEKFDVILCMEVVEHVADLAYFINSCAELLKEGGLFFLSTINRTIKSYAQAIITAEYILRWLPRGTHQWKKFVKPSEIKKHLNHNDIQLLQLDGMKYSIIHGDWHLSQDPTVNYILMGRKNLIEKN